MYNVLIYNVTFSSVILHMILQYDIPCSILGLPVYLQNNTINNIKINCLSYYINLLNLLEKLIISLVAIMSPVGSKTQVGY